MYGIDTSPSGNASINFPTKSKTEYVMDRRRQISVGANFIALTRWCCIGDLKCNDVNVAVFIVWYINNSVKQ